MIDPGDVLTFHLVETPVRSFTRILCKAHTTITAQ